MVQEWSINWVPAHKTEGQMGGGGGWQRPPVLESWAQVTARHKDALEKLKVKVVYHTISDPLLAQKSYSQLKDKVTVL